jgi:hypothetical protein
MINAVQVWNPDDWESFSLSLLQNRHGPLNIQKIPAAHKGDYGIDYYCPKEAVAYQCYSVEEPIDIATRAERQKRKITSDIGKVLSNHLEIGKLFLGVPIKHWVLLAPLHDSKEVNLHCAKKTGDLRNANCVILDALFEVAIHDPNSFPADAVAATGADVDGLWVRAGRGRPRLRRRWPRVVQYPEHVRHAYAGLRPLVRSRATLRPASRESRLLEEAATPA